jgi:acyl carrier protein
MNDAADIELRLFAILHTYVSAKSTISLESRIVADLNLTSDDATQLALDLESQFKVRIPREKWRSVYTVKDLVDLLSQYAGSE